MKKIILTVLFLTSLLFSNKAFALFSVSLGVPLNASYSESGVEHDSISGYFVGIQLPFAVGFGVDSYKANVKNSTYDLNSTAYNIFYQLPIPIVNLVLGIGTGSDQYDCPDVLEGAGGGTVISCEDFWDKGSITQWYTSIGIPIIPFFDFHLSYRSISSKNVKVKNNATNQLGMKHELSRSVTGVGIALNF